MYGFLSLLVLSRNYVVELLHSFNINIRISSKIYEQMRIIIVMKSLKIRFFLIAIKMSLERILGIIMKGITKNVSIFL
jgi:hypothetical protein